MRVISYHQGGAQQNHGKESSRKTVWVISVIFLFLAGIGYLIFFADFFDIRGVKINAPEKISMSDIDKNVKSWLDADYLGIKRRSNYFLFNPKKLSASLLSKLIVADSVEIERKGHDLDIKIILRKPVGVWCLTKFNDCYYFDDKGIAYEKASQTEGFIYAVITDNRDRKIEISNEVETSQWRDRIFTIRNLLRRNGFETAEFIVPALSYDEFEIRTFSLNDPEQKYWLLKISSDTDKESQISAFIDLYNKKLTPDERSQLEYVDLRVPERIYYK